MNERTYKGVTGVPWNGEKVSNQVDFHRTTAKLTRDQENRIFNEEKRRGVQGAAKRHEEIQWEIEGADPPFSHAQSRRTDGGPRPWIYEYGISQ